MAIRVDASTYDIPSLNSYQAFQFRDESADSEQIALAMMPHEEIAAIRPPVPQMLFPPENVPHREPWTIEAAVGAPAERSWKFHGSRGTPRLRPKSTEAEMNSSLRNAMGMSANPYG